MNSSIAARSSASGVSAQSGPWTSASVSRWGTPRRAASAAPRVVFPDPLIPWIDTHRTSGRHYLRR